MFLCPTKMAIIFYDFDPKINATNKFGFGELPKEKKPQSFPIKSSIRWPDPNHKTDSLPNNMPPSSFDSVLENKKPINQLKFNPIESNWIENTRNKKMKLLHLFLVPKLLPIFAIIDNLIS